MTRYIRTGLMAVLATSAMLHSAEGVAEGATEAAPAKKSIVPAKYAGKYKGAGDAVAEFINKESSDTSGFQFQAFFALCRANGLDEAKVKMYEDQVFTENRHGAKGRARMTLGNMLRSLARKNGGLKGLNGEVTELVVAKVALAGAAAAAQAATTEQSTSDEQATATESSEDASASAEGAEESDTE